MSNGSGRSKLYILEPLVQKLPEVRSPKRHISFKEKLIWSGLAIVIYLVMSRIPLFGGAEQPMEIFGQLQVVLASRAGTLMQLGISPIVTSGIIMQLLVGANLINLELGDPRDKALFTGTQKVLAIIVGAVQASAFVLSGALTGGEMLGFGMTAFLILQLIIGVAVVLFLDELVSKYGFGSGISLFILGGVSAAVFWQAFNPTSLGGELGGAVPNFFSALMEGTPGALSRAFYRGANLPDMLGVISTVVIFFIAIYVINMRVEIPLSYSRYGGMRGRYPIQFLYASVIPVILSSVVFTNVSILARATNLSFLGSFDANGNPIGGLYYYLNSPNGISQVMAEPFHALFYLVALVVFCMGFAWLWVQMTNMAPSDVADQLKSSGMSIPGFRRDTRIMENMLSRYITPVTLLGGATIGALAAGANFLGALSTGTGIVLAVSIAYRLYREIAREQLSEMFPAARKLLGG
ncbi:hypothetical protein AKJ55_01265 [candidate division MSBL1 archaeon SCGC-AAA382M17]|uniref:Protein translocase subunit SecY n=1 Tax=candidate division MSBL1 archaeon SCGC-AAA382M17 TaxID=1698284 RepID=A0ABR5TK54_9EURY|nr:hypothetical protein AKJ55_01265 [candidate division MSBL1 archaeon SCGC-AAA382M17]